MFHMMHSQSSKNATSDSIGYPSEVFSLYIRMARDRQLVPRRIDHGLCSGHSAHRLAESEAISKKERMRHVQKSSESKT